MSTQPQLSPIEQLMQGQQPSGPSAAQPKDQSKLSPIEQLMQSSRTQAAPDQETTAFIPNARIRNLPNPAEGMTPGQALTNGVKTGAELGAIPASAIGLGEAAPVIENLAEHLPNLGKVHAGIHCFITKAIPIKP